MAVSETINTPPRELNARGEPRRVGVEIEYANLNVLDSANMIEKLFGGRQEQESEHRVVVNDTCLGDFNNELGWQGAHKPKNIDTDSEVDWEADTRAVLGRAVAAVVPTEIVCPPIPWMNLDRLETLFDHLRASGAEGTEAAFVYSFGLHLNPEVAEETAEYALRHLQAYAILEDWLREQIDIDVSRRLLPHIDPFPVHYLRRLMHADYNPTLQQLVRDYAIENQTRNRGLDMTPLFRHLDEETLSENMKDISLIKARPTFHYRLPNAQFSDPSWSPAVEWNRWLEVEKLACDADLLKQRKAEFSAWLAKPPHEHWIEKIKRWFA